MTVFNLAKLMAHIHVRVSCMFYTLQYYVNMVCLLLHVYTCISLPLVKHICTPRMKLFSPGGKTRVALQTNTCFTRVTCVKQRVTYF